MTNKHKKIVVTQLGTASLAATLTLQFRVGPDQVYVERLEGHICDPTSEYNRVMPPGSADWPLISINCSGPVAFSLDTL